jgi:hypothetical protein
MSSIYANLQRVVTALLSPTDYYAVYTAQIVTVNADSTLDISPQNPRFAGMQNVPLYPGTVGCIGVPPTGAMCLFSFSDGDPGSPYVLGILGNATMLYLNPANPASSTLAAARVTDPVEVAPTMGTWIGGVTTYINTLVPGTLTPPTDFGIIKEGSGTVKIGN